VSGPSGGVLAAVGNTPLIEIGSLSRATGCRILVKCENLNPGGSVKDRAAARILLDAEAQGKLVPRHLRPAGAPTPIVVEGTGGNTGIALALLAAARGYDLILTMPDNIAPEKIRAARLLGAEVVVCAAQPFSNPGHFYHTAGRLAAERGGVWVDQFENASNSAAHYDTTAPEIWAQSGGRVDAFVAAAGTGGTLAGVSTYLRGKAPACKVFLVDPPGSSLAAFVETGVMAPASGTTITEGIGINRLTANMKRARVDAVFRGTDAEAVAMAYYLLRREGIWVGPSAALNVVGAVKAARALGPGHTVVTILCDGGERYATKVFDPAWMAARGYATDVDAGRDHADFVA
jgi:cysteine synthase A